MGPEPFVVEIAIEPRTKEDHAALHDALAKLAADDPAFDTIIDPESGQTILRGASEAEIEARVASLSEQGIGFNIGAPQVAYREALGRAVEIDHIYARVLGSKGDFARVRLQFEPGVSGSGFVFENMAGPDDIPPEFVPAVRAGLEAARDAGLIAGFPVIDFKATLVGGAFHDTDSSAPAFELAARRAFEELREKGAPELLEPIMTVEVLIPEGRMGDAIGDLNSRRGRISDRQRRGDVVLIRGDVPLSNMFGYGRTLDHLTDGLGRFTMAFSRYEPVPVFDDDPRNFPPAIGMRA